MIIFGILMPKSQLHTWLTQVLGSHSLSPLAGDASGRSYMRATTQDGTFMVMHSPEESIARFVKTAQILGQAVKVPKIFAQDETKGFLVLEDFGKVEFGRQIAQDKSTRLDWYHKALQVLLDLQALPLGGDLTDYSAAMLDEEMALFSQWFLPYIGIKIDAAGQTAFLNLKRALIWQIQSQPKTIVHRDFHSRNLMIADQNIGVLDFQDAVNGAYTYDLMSLLKDAYVCLNSDEIDILMSAFANASPKKTDAFILDCATSTVQRHLKVLGIFVRLYQRDNKARYLASLPKVLLDLKEGLKVLKHQTADKALLVYAREFDAWFDGFSDKQNALLATHTGGQL